MAWRSSLPNPARRARWDTLDLCFLTLDLSYSPSALFYNTYIRKNFLCLYTFYNELQFSDCLIFLCLTDKEHVNPRLSLINVPALNYLLRSQIFVNNDGQFRAAHLVLDYEPLSRTFQDVDNAIRANDYLLARIDVSWPHFLAPHDLPPVDHPIPQGVPLAAQPIQQVPLGQAVAEEGIASSSSLEEEINKFQFEEETQGIEAIVISEAEEETEEYSCIQTPTPIITYMEDSSDNKVEEMAPKSGPSLREFMKGRNKAPTPQETNKSKPPVNPPPPPLQLPADLGLKPNPELRRKRHHEAHEKGEIGSSKGNKQQRVSQDQRSKRSNSVESWEDPLAAHIRRTPRTWSPKLKLDGVPIAWDTSIKNYQGGQAGHITEALEQPLLLPRDIEAYRRFGQQELFLSLKRDLAMVSTSILFFFLNT